MLTSGFSLVFTAAFITCIIATIAHSIWVRWLSDDAPGSDMTLREYYTLGARVEIPLVLLALFFLALSINIP